MKASPDTMVAPPGRATPPTAANSSAATRTPSAHGSCETTTPARSSGATAAITHPPPYRGTARNPGRPQPRRPPHRSPRTGAQPDYPSCCRDGNNGRFLSEPSPHIPAKQGHTRNKISRVHTGSGTTNTPTHDRDASVARCAEAVRFSGLPSPGWWVGGGLPMVAVRRPAARTPAAGGRQVVDERFAVAAGRGSAARRSATRHSNPDTGPMA